MNKTGIKNMQMAIQSKAWTMDSNTTRGIYRRKLPKHNYDEIVVAVFTVDIKIYKIANLFRLRGGLEVSSRVLVPFGDAAPSSNLGVYLILLFIRAANAWHNLLNKHLFDAATAWKTVFVSHSLVHMLDHFPRRIFISQLGTFRV